MVSVTRRTVRNGVIGGVIGALLGFVPLVLLVAPFIGGGVAGYLERNDARAGAVAGTLAGIAVALLSVFLTTIVVALRFGDIPLALAEGPIGRLAVTSLLSLVGVVGQVLVASLGGALGGILATTHRTRRDRAKPAKVSGRGRTALVILASLLAGFLTFAVVGVAVTAVLDPLIWPSAIVGLPVGVVAGVSIAIVSYAFFRRGTGTERHWQAIGLGLLAVAVMFAILLGGLWVLGQDRISESHESTYEYQVTLDTDGTLVGPTIYVPAPSDTDDVRLSTVFVDDVRADRVVPVFPAGGGPEPVNFSYRRVETEHGPMIAISADRIAVSRYYFKRVENETMGRTVPIDPAEYDPDDPSMGVADDGRFTFTVTMTAQGPIRTADPFDTEPLLVPQYERTENECMMETSDRERCFAYESRVYAEYGTDENVTVSLTATAYGRNEWFSGGWNGNEYRDRVAVKLRGPQSGWHVGRGDLEVGSGSYVD